MVTLVDTVAHLVLSFFILMLMSDGVMRWRELIT